MKRLLVSGLVNQELSAPAYRFPIAYQSLDYRFGELTLMTSGVAFNIAKNLKTLGDDVSLFAMIGNDEAGAHIIQETKRLGIVPLFEPKLKATPLTNVLFDANGKRMVICDLQDVQEQTPSLTFEPLNYDLAILCNTNFNRKSLPFFKQACVLIATDIHLIDSVDNDYNREFMEYADILFLSDEDLREPPETFIKKLARKYGNKITVIGCGEKGALMYEKKTGAITMMPSIAPRKVVNTIGAGDCLFSTFIHFYVNGYRPVECLKLAVLNSGNKIGVSGAATGFISEADLLLLKKNY